MSQCVFGSFCISIYHCHGKLLFVEVAQTPACQDIESTGFLTRKKDCNLPCQGALCAGEKTGLHFCICFVKRSGV